MLLFEEESALRLISQFVFHDAQGMHQFLMVSRFIAVYGELSKLWSLFGSLF